ncbi:DUF4138 domain-containing protein [Myroides sp. LJL119]
MNKLLAIIGLLFIQGITAQSTKGDFKLQGGHIGAYPIEITHNKTTHLLFNSPIAYVDLGSHEILASRVDPAHNVLRVKAVSNSMAPTNFTVITNKGDFYNFDVSYALEPKSLSYDLNKLVLEKDNTTSEYLVNDSWETQTTSMQLTDFDQSDLKQIKCVVQNIINSQNNYLNVVGKNDFFKASLKSIYTHNKVLYFHFNIQNRAYKNLEIDKVNFRINTRESLKGVLNQSKEVNVLYSLPNHLDLQSFQKVALGIAISDFDLAKDQVLTIEFTFKDSRDTTLIVVKPFYFSDIRIWKDASNSCID